MDELLQEPEAMDFQLDPMGPPVPPQAMPVPPQAPPMQGNLDQFLQANPNLPRIMRPDNSLIADSYRGIPGAPVPPPQRPDPMQELLGFANRGNRQAQVAYIHLLQRNAQLSHAERLRMQRMQTAIGHITNDPGLMFNEKVNAIRQLQTGVDFYMQREKMAQAKAMAEQRQMQAQQMKDQQALMTAITTMGDAEFSKWAAANTKYLPSGHMLTVMNGKLHVSEPPKVKERDYAKDYDHAHQAIVRRKASMNKNPMPGDPEPTASPEEVKTYLRDMYRVADEIEAERGGKPKSAASSPMSSEQIEYNEIKAAFPGGAATIKDPAILKRVMELRAAGAK